jgi:hypothetical protein
VIVSQFFWVRTYNREDGEVDVTPGTYNPTGPRCMIRMMDGIRTGRCLDGDSLDSQPGGPVHVFPCTKRWNQFFSFGNGKEVPKMAIHTNVPLHTRKRIAETGRAQEPYMCLGVPGRGKMDEEDWLGVRGEENENDSSNLEEVGGTEAIDKDSFSLEEDDSSSDETGPTELSPLSEWERKQLIATRCSNTDALIEWLVVPFIMEDYVTSDTGIDEEAEEL